jgi:hypothetical protein
MIVGEPLGDPQPFMGTVIDNDSADRIQESFLDLVLKGAARSATWIAPSPIAPSCHRG